ncbi:Acyl-CoA N-acyltransferase [Penicillium taxi]|uniref:Acyl-CoA N-acyltransferase n=1 Tax=Penicillium taxi TaxID=168475 RepID=UPI0025455432|nr:Acyl-CoA N-acyltransferase [Penicillium taxi]KAJ5908786.1 Acyl-CoA N-acyltransferase [Penicillium taxi]
MAATVPPVNDDPGQLDPHLDPLADQVDSDLDAEGEEETDMYGMDQQLQDAVHRAYTGELGEEVGQSWTNGEVHSVNAQPDGDNDETEPVGAVKLPDDAALSDDEDEESADSDPPFEDDDNENDRDVSEHSEPESEAEEDWEDESNGQEDGDLDIPSRATCLFCSQDEEHDPGEDFEEWLSCIVCGDHSHRQCARDQDAFNDSDDPWRCPTCAGNGFEPDPAETSETQPKSGTTHLPKELLPAHTGASNSGFHSIFDTKINEDVLNSSRSLRKRKASDVEEHVPVLRKRRRQTEFSLLTDGAIDGADVNANAGAGETSPAQRPTRSRRARGLDQNCRIVSRGFSKLILGFRIGGGNAERAIIAQSRPQRRRKKASKPPPVPQPPQAHFAPIPPVPYNYITPFHDRDGDDSKSKPYGGILTDTEADTSKTLPTQLDREKFEHARQKAEDEWQQKVREAELNGEAPPSASQKVSGPPSKIKCINFGGYEIETWYAAPYPEEYSRNRVLYICEFCLKYMNSDYVAWRHKLKCPAKHPPGDEIYRDGSVSIFEVDGRKNPVYCQNLCLLAKLFLGSKTLYYDVEPFLFYVMSEYDDLGCHFVGYFSKEKRPSSANNVSCILTLPIHQRKGYGNLLIDFSYLLTRIEGKNGSPEKPLSDMGLVSYRNYWRLILSYQLRDLKTPISIADLSDRTGMTADDLVSALEGLRALVRDPITKTYAIRLDTKYFEEVISGWENKGYVQLNPDALQWTPYVMGRNNQSHFEHAPMHAVAARDDEDEDETDESPMMNGGFGETAGPPSTAHLLTNGVHPHREPSPIPNPAAGIPPSRFELWPPVHVPASRGRKPGRPPSGRKTSHRGSIMPSTPRTSGRNTPRRGSALPAFTPMTNSPMRRGRSALLTGSPAVEDTTEDTPQEDTPQPQPKGVDTEEAVEENADPTPSVGLDGAFDSRDETANVNGEAETNGVHSESPVKSPVPRTPQKKTHLSRSPGTATSHRSKRFENQQSQNQNPTKTPQSVGRKALIEKVQVMIPAEIDSPSRRGKKAVTKTNGISEHASTADDDADAEYEADGDVVMET